MTGDLLRAFVAFLIGFLPAAGLWLQGWRRRSKDKDELSQRDEVLSRRITATDTRVTNSDENMRLFVLSVAQDSDRRLREMETKLETATSRAELAEQREGVALGKVSSLTIDLAIAQRQIADLTERINQLDKQLLVANSTIAALTIGQHSTST